MTAQHIALRIILFDVRPLLVEIHHVNAFVFIDRAKQFRVFIFFLADREVHIRRCAVYCLEIGQGLICFRQFDALVRRLKLFYTIST